MLLSEALVIRVSRISPRISSIRAAPKMALPERVDSLPISFRVSTLMETEVAVNTVPTNMFSRKEPPWLKTSART